MSTGLERALGGRRPLQHPGPAGADRADVAHARPNVRSSAAGDARRRRVRRHSHFQGSPTARRTLSIPPPPQRNSAMAQASVSAAETAAIAREAYTYGFPMVDSYRIL